MKKSLFSAAAVLALFTLFLSVSHAVSLPFFGGKFKEIEPKNNHIEIPLKDVNDGKAHYFKVRAEDGIMVSFFVLKSRDNVMRAAVDACDVCYKAGKGYVQQGDMMVCENCGMKFASSRINVVKGGCNPAPLQRSVEEGNLVIPMEEINKNSWYCKFKKQG